MSRIPSAIERLLLALEAALIADDPELATTSARTLDSMLRSEHLDAETIGDVRQRLQACQARGEVLRSEARGALVARQRSRGQLRNYQRIARSGLRER